MISVHTFICMFDVCVRCLVCWIDPADKNTVWYLMWWRQATERQRMFGVLIRMMQFLFGEIEPKTNKIIYKSICEHTFIFGCLLLAVAGEKDYLFDIRKFSHIGKMSNEYWTCVMIWSHYGHSPLPINIYGFCRLLFSSTFPILWVFGLDWLQSSCRRILLWAYFFDK